MLCCKRFRVLGRGLLMERFAIKILDVEKTYSKSKDRKQDVKSGPSFQFTTCSPTKKDMFLRKMKQANASED